MRLLFLCFTGLLFSLSGLASVNRDLKILHESIYGIEKLESYYDKEVFSLIDSLREDPNKVFNQKQHRKIANFWGQFVDYRVALGLLYTTYNDGLSAQAKLISYTANLHLNKSAALLSFSLWDNPKGRAKLNEASLKSTPRGYFISLENNLFRQFDNKFDEQALPVFFPVNNLNNDRENYLAIVGELYQDEIYNEIARYNQRAEIILEKYMAFVTDSKNLWTVKKRFVVYKFKNLFFNLVKKIGSWLGATKIHRRDTDYYNGETLIDMNTAVKAEKLALPGDMIISKTEWFLSNLFLPGFWPHSFIYVGDEDKLKNYFIDNEVDQYFRTKCIKENIFCYDIISYLQNSALTKAAWEDYTAKDKYGLNNIVIEATRDGVHFSSIRNSFLNDYLSIMRPRVTKLDKAMAIVSVFGMNGLPYDFDFDFQTDDRIVCSELVTKAYDQGGDQTGIRFDYDLDKNKYFEKLLGRVSMPVINFVHKIYDENKLGLRPSEVEFIAFLKGDKKLQKAVFATESELYKTKDWSKWSFHN